MEDNFSFIPVSTLPTGPLNPTIKTTSKQSIKNEKAPSLNQANKVPSLAKQNSTTKVPSSKSQSKSLNSSSKLQTKSNQSVRRNKSVKPITTKKPYGRFKPINEDDDFWITFDQDDIYSKELFTKMDNNWVDGDYLTSLMPQNNKENKLEILDILDGMCCTFMECNAERGTNPCEFAIPEYVPGYPKFDHKEMAGLLFTRITSRGGIFGYAKPLKNGTYSLVLTWQPKPKNSSSQISAKSVKSSSSNKK